MKKLGVVIPLVCFLLVPCFVLPADVSAAGLNNYNFSREGYVVRELDAASLLSRYLEENGAALSTFEEDYLRTHSSLRVLYSDNIPSSSIGIDFDASAQTLSVTARPESYRTAGATLFTWTPESVNGDTMSESGGSYSYTMSTEGYEEDSVEVRYAHSVPIAAADLNGILNLTRNDGQKALARIAEKRAAYQQALKDYEAQVAAYEAYEKALAQYELDAAAYAAYLPVYREWARKDVAYRNYQQELARYREEKAAYDNYSYQAALDEYNLRVKAYNDYVAALDQYEKDMRQYAADTASEDAQTQLHQLAILQFMTDVMTEYQRSLFVTIMSDTVTMVIDALGALEDALELLQVSREAIENANDAVVELRKTIPIYNSCKTDMEKYFYYINYHDVLTDNFCELFRSLDYFYHGFAEIRAEIGRRNSTEKFEILLAQLYMSCLALNDGPLTNFYKEHTYKYDKWAEYGPDYVIGPPGKQRSPKDVLEGRELQDLGKGAPLEGGYVSLPPEPQKPEPVDPPGAMPKPMPAPVEPAPVEDPGKAPDVVAEPHRPVPVEDPGDVAPSQQPLTEDEKAFEELDRGHGMPEARAELGENYTLKLTAAVTKYFRNFSSVDKITFYDAYGAETYSVREAVVGESVQYGGVLPTKSRTGYDCTFAGWQDGSGNVVDLNRIPAAAGELKLYPFFTETPKLYTVVWIVAGEARNGTCAYGEVPVYDAAALGDLTMSDGSIREYRFTGWVNQRGNAYAAGDALPAMGDGNAVYTARFERGCIVTWSVDGALTSEAYWMGDTPAYGAVPARARDARYVYTFAGWMAGGKLFPEVPVVSGDVTYTASFARDYIVDLGGSGATVSEEEGYLIAEDMGQHDTADMGVLFALAAEANAGVKFRLAGCEFTLLPSDVYLAAEGGIETVSASAVQTGMCCYDYLITMQGRTRAFDGVAVHLAAAGVFDTENSYLTEYFGGEKRDVRFAVQNGVVSFTAYAGRRYSIGPEYYVNIIPCEEVAVETSTLRARAGERITITVGEPVEGMHLQSVFVRDANGADVTFKNDVVTMPVGGMSVGAVCARNSYTFVFRADGKVIATLTYLHGETVVPPDGAPVKASDGENTYTFAGWDKPFGPATGDMEYNAVYTAVPVQVAPKGISKLELVVKIAYVVLPVFLVVFVAGVALLILYFVQRRKKKAARGAAQAAKEGKVVPAEPISEPASEPVSEPVPAAEPAEEPVLGHAAPSSVAPMSEVAGAGEPASEEAAPSPVAPMSEVAEAEEPVAGPAQAPEEAAAELAVAQEPAEQTPEQPQEASEQPEEAAEEPSKQPEESEEGAEDGSDRL